MVRLLEINNNLYQIQNIGRDEEKASGRRRDLEGDIEEATVTLF